MISCSSSSKSMHSPICKTNLSIWNSTFSLPADITLMSPTSKTSRQPEYRNVASNWNYYSQESCTSVKENSQKTICRNFPSHSSQCSSTTSSLDIKAPSRTHPSRKDKEREFKICNSLLPGSTTTMELIPSRSCTTNT